ncbi:MAG: hypothetical protein IPJ54_00035 [Saprospiraceae bacterium]|nr:hypothetical protein [Saprospiraceae bacterium]
MAMLAALIYLYLNGSGSWDIRDLYQAGASLDVTAQQWVFLGLVFGLCHQNSDYSLSQLATRHIFECPFTRHLVVVHPNG